MLECDTTIRDLVASGPTAFPLDVPVTPRYFLSAVKRVLDRGHVHRLYFRDAEARDRAAVVLNSSLAYWWWRAYEGGITVSRTILLSVPVPITTADPALVAALDVSEIDNVVVKRNAGRPNENVKHPWRLLRMLNEAVAPDDVDALLATHANSHLGIPATASPARGSSAARSAGPTPPFRRRGDRDPPSARASGT
jgi:hypothetical protein